MTDVSGKTNTNGNEAELMTKYGITRVPVDRFHYKTYRYSTLSDAVVQAKRDEGARTNHESSSS